MASIVKSSRRNCEMFVSCGFSYYFHRETSDGRKRWRCRQRLSSRCKAAIYTENNTVVSQIGHHVHAPNAACNEILRYHDSLRQEPTNVVVAAAAEVCQLSPAASSMVATTNLKRYEFSSLNILHFIITVDLEWSNAKELPSTLRRPTQKLWMCSLFL